MQGMSQMCFDHVAIALGFVSKDVSISETYCGSTRIGAHPHPGHVSISSQKCVNAILDLSCTVSELFSSSKLKFIQLLVMTS